jgi:antitoxin component YwqK of YwqJK toxin-antitoxin module
MYKYVIIISFIFLCGCSVKSNRADPSTLTSMQMMDRNGFSETVSSKDRLSIYQKVDFLAPQPYQKVLRVFGRDKEGKSTSKITSYHSNGQIWQFLEVIDGRAHGIYREWHPNGRLKIEASVIEGVADISEMAQTSWLFEGKSVVWDEEGALVAKIYYDKGTLQEPSLYYHANGQLQKIIPYNKNEIDGTVKIFDSNGLLLEKMEFDKGIRQGISFGYWAENSLKYQEDHQKDLLMTGSYFNLDGQLASEVKNGNGFQANFGSEKAYSLVEYQNGLPEGQVKIFDDDGGLHCSYNIKDEKKHGEEWEYYPKSSQPKLFVFWNEDAIQGLVKTWYNNGVMESQKEMNANKKHGISFAWFKDGQLMFMEEYDNDVLLKGTYFKKGDKNPVTRIDNGKGIASLYDGNGHFIKKVNYDRGRPILDPS